jgi:hypothetical protein
MESHLLLRVARTGIFGHFDNQRRGAYTTDHTSPVTILEVAQEGRTAGSFPRVSVSNSTQPDLHE